MHSGTSRNNWCLLLSALGVTITDEELELDLIRVVVNPNPLFQYELIYRTGEARGTVGVYSFDEEWYYLYKKDTEKYRVKRRKDLEGIEPTFTYMQQRKRPVKKQNIPPKESVEKSFPMKVEVKISALQSEGKIRALAAINLNNCMTVENIRIIKDREGLLVAMPSCKTDGGEDEDVCFPVNAAFKQQLEDEVIQAYYQEMDIKRLQDTLKEETVFEGPLQIMGSM